jgi:chromosomal replication initiation ATPase DnaA
MKSMSQEFFQFGFIEPLKDDDFIVSGSNSTAFNFITTWPNWESKTFLIYGPPACGKTHLARIWQNKSGASYITANDIYSENYSTADNYILENIESMHDEATFLHFFNTMKEKGTGYLLMTAPSHPQHMGIRLPDLRSRLNAIPSAGVTQPDDELLRTIFVKQFADRQLKVEMDVINYIITRMERSFEALYKMVSTLDKQALKEKKNITIPFARSILEKAE